jgi:hypothetical protein
MTPSNFIDSPHDLDRLIRNAVNRHMATSANRIRADVYERDVVLSGVVGSWYQKQLVQESILSLDDIGIVDNRIIVDYADKRFDPTS